MPQLAPMPVQFREAELKPHQSQYWLTPSKEDAQFEEKVRDICQTYISAIERSELGKRKVCSDEMTGIQAIERKERELPQKLNPCKMPKQFLCHRHRKGEWRLDHS